MRPLEESLRGQAAAVSGRPSSKQGGREQLGGEAGAFETAVADAGRQKAQGQVPVQGTKTETGSNSTAIGSQDTPRNFAIGNRGTDVLIGSNAAEAADRIPAISIQALGLGETESAADTGETTPSDPFETVHENAATAYRRGGLMGRTHVPAADEQGADETETDARATAATGLLRRQGQAAAGPSTEVLTTEMADGDAASAGPANGTVDDILTMLGGVAMPAVGMQPEGKTSVPAGERTVDGMSVKIDGVLSDAAGQDHPQIEQHSDDMTSDRLFRFARADGKGQAVSMSISKDGDRVAVESGKSVGSKAETVTVLEARRYLGVAMNASSSSVTDAISGDAAQSLQPSAALAQPGAWSQAGKTLNTLKIQLHPIELGMVTATLRLKDDELQVDLKVETGEAFRQLSDDQSEMVKALRAQGFAVDHVNVVFNAGGDASNGSGSQPQTQLGQQSREGGRQERRQDGSQAATVERWTGNDGTDDAPVGAERPRAGHVYM